LKEKIDEGTCQFYKERRSTDWSARQMRIIRKCKRLRSRRQYSGGTAKPIKELGWAAGNTKEKTICFKGDAQDYKPTYSTER
jgi:hypothetical protein